MANQAKVDFPNSSPNTAYKLFVFQKKSNGSAVVPVEQIDCNRLTFNVLEPILALKNRTFYSTIFGFRVACF